MQNLQNLLNDYNIGSMNFEQAKFLSDLSLSIKAFDFNTNTKTIADAWVNAYQFCIDNKITDCAYFEQLYKKINNLNSIDNEIVFNHTKSIIDFHGMLISIKFGIPYPMF